MIALSDALEIARKKLWLPDGLSYFIREARGYWIFGWDWNSETMGPIPPGAGGPLIIYKDTGKYEFPPIPPRMTPQMRQEFRTAAVVHYPG